MSCGIENKLSEIDLLIAKKKLAKKGLLPKDEYINLLAQINAQYEALFTLYAKEGEILFACQAVLRSADILFELFEIVPDKIGKNQLQNLRDRFIKLSKECYDLEINRNFFVAIARLNYCLNEFIAAEEYIQKAFDDYDYSVSTFQLYMIILDKQRKYEKMLFLMKKYLNMSAGFHEKCSIDNFHVPNILLSPYASVYRDLFH